MKVVVHGAPYLSKSALHRSSASVSSYLPFRCHYCWIFLWRFQHFRLHWVMMPADDQKSVWLANNGLVVSTHQLPDLFSADSVSLSALLFSILYGTVAVSSCRRTSPSSCLPFLATWLIVFALYYYYLHHHSRVSLPLHSPAIYGTDLRLSSPQQVCVVDRTNGLDWRSKEAYHAHHLSFGDSNQISLFLSLSLFCRVEDN